MSYVDRIKAVLGRGAPGGCEHMPTGEGPPAGSDGCETCLAEGLRWVHLRRCLECGHVGCCSQSKGNHAQAHFEATGHPVIRSHEPGESWRWCYVDYVRDQSG